VATNTPPNGAFRGIGAPQTIWAIERHMDRIAAQLGLDPLEYKRRHLFGVGDVTATGQTLTESVGGEACLLAATRASEYETKRKAFDSEGVTVSPDGRRVRRGIGASVFFHGAGFTGSGERRLKGKVRVDLLAGGTLNIRTTSTDIGQGTETTFRQIAADAAHVPFDRVRFETPSTTRAPDSGPTVASRTTMVVGSVVAACAKTLRERVRASIAKAQGVDAARVLDAGEEFALEDPRRAFVFAAASDALLASDGEVFALQQYEPPGVNQWDDDTYSGDAYPVYSWGCDIAEVEVDMDTFETRVVQFWAAQDVGKAIHPVMCAGQVEGGTLQAIGWAVNESIVWDRGRIKNGRMTNYIIPTALDAPRFETILVEEPFSGGPFGAKGVGELPMDGGAPAVAAAIEQATGLSLNDLPLLPENVFDAWRAQKESR
jgi:CO/xanthine dehydrogenase Mo-binding subunit